MKPILTIVTTLVLTVARDRASTRAFACPEQRRTVAAVARTARDGVASAFTVPATWPAQLTKKWQATVGAGHSSPVISGNRVIVHARQQEREIVTASPILASGKQLWQDVVNAPYTA